MGLERVSRHVIIRGKVQRVGFRHWLAKEARRLGISGWCRNLPVGDVEAMLCGPVRTVQSFMDSCYRGPTFSDVQSIDIIGDGELSDGPFEVRDTA